MGRALRGAATCEALCTIVAKPNDRRETDPHVILLVADSFRVHRRFPSLQLRDSDLVECKSYGSVVA